MSIKQVSWIPVPCISVTTMLALVLAIGGEIGDPVYAQGCRRAGGPSAAAGAGGGGGGTAGRGAGRAGGRAAGGQGGQGGASLVDLMGINGGTTQQTRLTSQQAARLLQQLRYQQQLLRQQHEQISRQRDAINSLQARLGRNTSAGKPPIQAAAQDSAQNAAIRDSASSESDRPATRRQSLVARLKERRVEREKKRAAYFANREQDRNSRKQAQRQRDSITITAVSARMNPIDPGAGNP